MSAAPEAEVIGRNIPFWLVWEATGVPLALHTTAELAEEEARRLAQTYRGQKFYVLRPVMSVLTE